MDGAGEVKTSVASNREAVTDLGYELFRAKDPMTVVIFGASGDLSKRKLIPALYHLQEAGYLPDRYAVVGFSRTSMSDEAYRDSMHAALREQLASEGHTATACTLRCENNLRVKAIPFPRITSLSRHCITTLAVMMTQPPSPR